MSAVPTGNSLLLSAHAGQHREELPVPGIAWAVLARRSGKL